MSRFQVSQVDGKGGGGGGVGDGDRGVGDGGSDGVVGGVPNDGTAENGGIENPAMDPVELNVYGLYSKRNSGCPTQGELKRKSSYGFTQITR